MKNVAGAMTAAKEADGQNCSAPCFLSFDQYYDAYASYYDAVASYYDADMYDASYYLFGSYLSDETETDSKVGNTVAYSGMSGSL